MLRSVPSPRRISKPRTLVAAVGIAGLLVVPGPDRAEGARGHDARPVPMPAGYVNGIDVSHWQGAIDWSTVGRSGVRFAMAKATEGQTFDDPAYVRNRSGARAAGVRFGAYHYASPDPSADDAVLEADHFVAVADPHAGDLPPALDLEATGGLDTDALIDWTQAWLERVTERTGTKPMIYTSAGFWSRRLGGSTWFAEHGYAVWIAHWGATSPRVPAANWAGAGWSVWQVSSCGRVAGIAGCVDLDRAPETALATTVR